MDGNGTRTLRRREVEVLALVAGGLSNGQIARKLSISDATVKRHLANANETLGVHSRSAAVAEAARRGQVSPNAVLGEDREGERWRCAEEGCVCEVEMLCGPSGGAPPWRPPVCHGREMVRAR